MNSLIQFTKECSVTGTVEGIKGLRGVEDLVPVPRKLMVWWEKSQTGEGALRDDGPSRAGRRGKAGTGGRCAGFVQGVGLEREVGEGGREEGDPWGCRA